MRSGATTARVSYSKERELKTTLLELLIYITFLVTLSLMTFGMVSTNMYYLNKVMEDLFVEQTSSESSGINFRSIKSQADFWEFAEGPLLDGLYWSTWYDNRTVTDLKNASYIFYENLLLGVAQIRQLKVRNNTCSIYPYFQPFLKSCYSRYSYKAEDKSDFGLKDEPEWKYVSASSFSPWYWGSVGFYRSGGFIVTLPRSKQESMEKLASLRKNGWITHGTRAVFIDFSTFNANINLFCIVRLVVEFPATGGALTSFQIHSVKLLRYVSYYDYFLASCEVAFCLFILTFIIQEAIEITRLKMEYFRSAWNWLDMLLIAVSILAICFNIYRTIEVSLLMEELLSNAHVYPDFYFLAFWQVIYDNVIAINVFFAWIKIFKYVSFSKTMTQLSSTLSRCAKDIIGFAIMFFIIFIAYAQFSHLVFGPQVDDFSTFQNCIFSQFRIVLGDFNFESLEVNSILGPIYYISFVFFVFFVLLNMFLAIINDTYSEVKADFAVIPNEELHIADLFRQSYNKALVKLKLRKPETDLGDENLERSKEFPSTKRKDTSKPSKGGSPHEKRHPKPPKLQKESLHRSDSVAASQSSVSPEEFQRLLRQTSELEKELNSANAKLSRIMKSMQQLKNASGKTTQ
ncbi:polycystic kidney disease 2-like 2 protein isoform X3 [Gallus gallus]|uniref:polycystic kidney disease 2-like 2 protein isoform X3 n=1 Tax=Gallus gallus TaxID=9031 RepID=UPI001F00315F|nr:polycystic kidney disease 2-like 2 protein isoform X3 [Gallus gallus]XP_046783150.1 polycystic kidney disease 2-like 2 protein isoform X3 [Gallus gallus]